MRKTYSKFILMLLVAVSMVVPQSVYAQSEPDEEENELYSCMPEQGVIDLTTIGYTFRFVHMIYLESARPNPDFKGSITLTRDGETLETLKHVSQGEMNIEIGIIFSKGYTENGEYVVTIPEGAMLVGSSENERLSKPQELHFIIDSGFVKGEGITAFPETGSYVGELHVIEVQFNEHEFASKNIWYNYVSGLKKQGPAVIKNSNGEVVAECGTGDIEASAREHVINSPMFTFNKTITEYGDYTIEIPAGMITFDLNGGSERSTNYNEKIVLNYTIENEMFSSLPQQGILDLTTIGYTFRFVNMFYNEPVRPNPDFTGSITLTRDGETLETLKHVTPGEMDIEIGVIFSKGYTENGEYVITIPEGAMLVGPDFNSRPSKAQELHFIIDSGFVKGEGITVLPEEGYVDELHIIEVQFNEHEFASRNIWYNYVDELKKQGPAVIKNSNGDVVAECPTGEMEASARENVINSPMFTFSKVITENGIYTVEIPAGMVTFDLNGGSKQSTNYNEAITLTYTIGQDGVECIDAGDGHFDVYNLHGIKVLENTDAAGMRNLEKGIYIVNGKKVAIF